jgi:hypothetical protein
MAPNPPPRKTARPATRLRVPLVWDVDAIRRVEATRSKRARLLGAYFEAVAYETLAPAARYFASQLLAPDDSARDHRRPSLVEGAIEDLTRIAPDAFRTPGADLEATSRPRRSPEGLPSGIAVVTSRRGPRSSRTQAENDERRVLVREMLARLSAIEARYVCEARWRELRIGLTERTDSLKAVASRIGERPMDGGDSGGRRADALGRLVRLLVRAARASGRLCTWRAPRRDVRRQAQSIFLAALPSSRMRPSHYSEPVVSLRDTPSRRTSFHDVPLRRSVLITCRATGGERNRGWLSRDEHVEAAPGRRSSVRERLEPRHIGRRRRGRRLRVHATGRRTAP